MKLRSLLLIGVLSVSLVGCVTESTGTIPGVKPNLREAGRINTELGAAYARKGLFRVAEQKLKLAIKQRPGYALAHSVLGYVYWKRNQNDLAQQQYDRALDLSPNDPDIQNNYGVFLCATGQPGKARHYFQEAIANPNYGTPESAWVNAAVCARSHGDVQLAERDLRQALILNSRLPAALEQMVLLAYQQKQYQRVRNYFDRYRKQVTHPGPSMLYVMARTERALGNDQAARNYETQLVQQYPDSDEAAHLTQSNPLQ